MQEKMEQIVREVVIPFLNENVDIIAEYFATKEDLQNVVINAGAVTSVHGRRGDVVAQKGDYTAELVGAAKELHAEEHYANGKDPLDVVKLGAAKADHVHGNISNNGSIGNVNGKVIMTGVGGVLEAKDKSELGFVTNPALVATSGAITFTAENNKEYEYTGVTSLEMTGAKVSCHGTLVFADSVPTISVAGFAATDGDDITKAAAKETWEFDVFAGRILWKNWGVI
jgi:large exoprotein involved in heme utilization and adhesion